MELIIKSSRQTGQDRTQANVLNAFFICHLPYCHVEAREKRVQHCCGYETRRLCTRTPDAPLPEQCFLLRSKVGFRPPGKLHNDDSL